MNQAQSLDLTCAAAASSGGVRTVSRRAALLTPLVALALPAYLGCVSEPDPEAASEEAITALSGGTPIRGLAGKCLDASLGGVSNGSPLQLWTCNNTTAQQWTVQGATIVGPGGKCVDISGNNQVPGTQVQLYDCNGTDAQKWTIRGGNLVSTRGLCLDVRYASSSDGARVQVWTCNGGANQTWQVATGAPSPACRHFRGGNYVREIDSRATGADALRSIDFDLGPQGPDFSNFAGFLLQIDWAMVEPSRGVYDFSRLDAALKKMEDHGKSLRIKIMDRTFFAGCNPAQRVWPSYATGAPATWDARTCYADVWNPATVDGLIALHIAIARRYGARTAFAGFTSEEMAIGPTDMANRTRGEYAQRLRLAQELFASVPDAIFISEFNWPLDGNPSTLPSMVEQSLVRDASGKIVNGMGVSWPDSWLNPSTYSAADLTRVLPKFQCTQSRAEYGKVPCSWYDAGRAYRSKVIIAPGVEGGGVLLGTRAEAEAHYRMLDEDIGAHMITWDTWDQYNNGYISNAVIPVVNARAGRLRNSTCPF